MNDEEGAAEFGYARVEALLVLRRFEDGRLACEEFAPWFGSHATHSSAAQFQALRTFFDATAAGLTPALAALAELENEKSLPTAGKLDLSLLRGDLLAKLGRVDESRSALVAARKWARLWKVPASEVAAWLALARCDEIQGDHVGLRDDLEAAGRVARAANSLDMTVTVMIAEATHLRSAGSLDAARDALVPALKLLDGRPEALVPVRALLGDLEIDRGAFVDAERYLGEALDAPPSTAAPLITARAAASVSLGVLLSRRGRHEEGVARLREGLATLRTQGDRFAQASTQVLLARALLSVGPSQEVLDLLAAAERAATAIGADDVLARAAAIRADALRATGDAEAALAAVRQADGLVQRALRWRTGDGGGELPREGARLYGVGVWAAMKLGRPDDLLWSLERSRAIDFLVSLGGTRSLPVLSLPAELRESLVTSESRFEDLRIHRSDDGSSGSGGAAPINDGRREADLAAVVQSLAKARAEADAHLRGGGDLTTVEPIDVAGVRALVGPRAVFVEYGAFAGRLMALVVDAASARVVDLGALDVVEREVGALVEAMRTENDARASSEDAIATVASAVARLVVAPLALPAEAELVVISPDGILRDVAFALLLPGRGLALVPSASIWAALVARAQGSGEGVLALPDAAATEPRLKEALASRSRWAALHVRCRGLVDDRRPPFGSISLASPPSSDAETWTHREILATAVNADLVVLTGCGTSRTVGARRDGAVGLVHAFLYAGAPCVLSARWPVDDDATKILLARFHERWRPKDGSPGVSPATALRDAQQAVRETERFRHPRFYAGWELHGVPGSP